MILNFALKNTLKSRFVLTSCRYVQYSNAVKLRVAQTLGTSCRHVSTRAAKHGKVLLAVGFSTVVHLTKASCEAKNVDYEKIKALTQSKYISIEPSVHRSFSWKRLWAYLKEDSLILFVSIASALVIAILNIRIPIMMGELTHVVSKFSDSEEMWALNDFAQLVQKPAVRLFTLYVAQAFFTFINISSLSVFGERLATKLKGQLFDSILRQDMAYFDSMKSGEITSRIASEVQEFKSSFKLCISQGLRSSLQCAGCAISLYLISPQMTFLMLGLLPTMVFVGAIIGRALREASYNCQEQTARATAVIAEALGNVRTVRAFAMEEAEKDSFAREQKQAEALCVNLAYGIGTLQALTNMALNGVVITTLLFGGYLMSHKELTAGSLMAFLVATQTIQKSLAQLSLVYGQYLKMITCGSRIFSILDLKPTIRQTGGIRISNVEGLVEFRDVSFAYPSRPEKNVLKSFNFVLKPGKVTAVVGTSGAGKSTLVNLLERFYDASQGVITIDGHDLKQIDPSWLRGHLIGYISQEPVLFGTSIFENIRYGKPDASAEQVYAAAKMASAHEFITSFPDGYRTVLGERGVTLSGGQKQRIAIARAIIKNPTILILDEATSALDTQSEKVVQEALERLMKDRTVLVIAHRLSTIKSADEIFVMSHGKVVESGTHQQLLAKKGVYWRLVSDHTSDSETI